MTNFKLVLSRSDFNLIYLAFDWLALLLVSGVVLYKHWTLLAHDPVFPSLLIVLFLVPSVFGLQLLTFWQDEAGALAKKSFAINCTLCILLVTSLGYFLNHHNC